jgi:hypothetical protein
MLWPTGGVLEYSNLGTQHISLSPSLLYPHTQYVLNNDECIEGRNVLSM